MLIISRKLKEKLHVGDSVITVTRVAGNRVTLGIQARPEIKIVRSELVDKSVARDGECGQERKAG